MKPQLLLVRDREEQEWTPSTIRECGKNEAWLERVIGRSPSLLGLESYRTQVRGPYVAFHQLRVDTPSEQAIEPDIVFLTDSGHVVVVEVKLNDNPELRGRMVVAQVVEYAASLATYSESELTRLFGKQLPEGAHFTDVVRACFPECQDPIDLAAELVRKMRAAEIHLVIACDIAPEGLRELVAAVTAQHSLGNYELRVCELVPYVGSTGPDGGLLLVPGTSVRTEIVARTTVEVRAGADGHPSISATTTPLDEVQDNLAAAISDGPRPTHSEILRAVEAYLPIAEPGTWPGGRAEYYRYIRVDGWPALAHYEFIHLKTQRTIGAELHFEGSSVQPLSDAVRAAGLTPTTECPGLVWDQKWAKGVGRLRALVPEDTDPRVVARGMGALIRATRPIVEREIPRFKAP